MPTRSRRHHRRARVAPAALILAALVAAALLLPASGSAAGGGTGSTSHGGQGGKSQNPFRGDGMWIWYVKKSSGGKLSKIARKAKNHGIRTLYVKSSDGTSAWSQFTPGLVKYFHRHGLRVCAWQYVYGAHPKGEAKQGAAAVRDGADCLVIDAEAEYEGRYGAADTYVDKLRHAIGRHFPTALSSFPYVDYHPSFPYSVFLGKGGARFNLPQVYWHAIGVGVGQADRHTIRYNRVYERGIYPVGQTYKDAGGRPSKKQIQKFRRLAISFGFHGISWWSWQHTSTKQWRALGRHVDAHQGSPARLRQLPRPLQGQQGRPGRLGAGAPARRRCAPGRRWRLRQEDAPRGEALPAQAPPARRRQDRPANLALPAEGQARHGRLVEQAAPPLRQAGAGPD